MIRTRPDEDVAGYGDILIAISQEELELIGAMIGMIRLGKTPYQSAAMRLIDTMEQVTLDDDWTSTALGLVAPVLEVRDDDFDIIARYDEDHIFEFVV